ncbi:MAG: HAD family phosphatase, partial [Butyrivibrio sp.]|nr:HAD family phosphatase [Butyrivibrio sp.]
MVSIVFDMDGVLFDTQKIYCRAWEEAAQVLGIPDIGEPLRRCIGMNRSDQEMILKEFYHEDFPYDDFYREKDRAFDEILSRGVPLMRGTRELLEFLK